MYCKRSESINIHPFTSVFHLKASCTSTLGWSHSPVCGEVSVWRSPLISSEAEKSTHGHMVASHTPHIAPETHRAELLAFMWLFIFTNRSEKAAEEHPHTMLLPPPCFTAGLRSLSWAADVLLLQPPETHPLASGDFLFTLTSLAVTGWSSVHPGHSLKAESLLLNHLFY